MRAAVSDRLAVLARWEPVFAATDLDVGRWRTSEPDDAGVVQMPWYEHATEVERFIGEMMATGWVHDFDWMTWSGTPAARQLREDPSTVVTADAEDLGRLLTTIIRAERFGGGELAAAHESGLLTAIAVRARVLATDALPFDRYEGGGRVRLGKPRLGNATARSGYGPPVFAQCGYRCVYCGLDMLATFENWLQLSVDHVIPRQMRERGYDASLIEDIQNLVTCCRACNDFGNRYTVPESPPATDEAFFDLRDQVFRERKGRILAKRDEERATYEKIPAVGPDRTPPRGEDA